MLKKGIDSISGYIPRCNIAHTVVVVSAGRVSGLYRMVGRAQALLVALRGSFVLAALQVDRPPFGSLCIRTIRYPGTEESSTNS